MPELLAAVYFAASEIHRRTADHSQTQASPNASTAA
jgi:hypothetical protein